MFVFQERYSEQQVFAKSRELQPGKKLHQAFTRQYVLYNILHLSHYNKYQSPTQVLLVKPSERG